MCPIYKVFNYNKIHYFQDIDFSPLFAWVFFAVFSCVEEAEEEEEEEGFMEEEEEEEEEEEGSGREREEEKDSF